MASLAAESAPPAIRILLELYAAALAAADPLRVVPHHLPPPPRGRTVVVGAGKAAAAMAQAVERHWIGPLEGVVVVPQGAVLETRAIRVLEASHPVPDARSLAAARQLEAAIEGLTADDLVIALVSGGGSSLCAAPAGGLTLEAKQQITRDLLRSGASISEVNTVRSHLSALKGGRLAAKAYPAPVCTLLISDIPGDAPELIASGPTIGDPTTCADALAVLRRYGIPDLEGVYEALGRGAWESVKPDDARLRACKRVVVASARTALQAAADEARARGMACHVLSDAMEGEARELAKAHAAIALHTARHGTPFRAPCVILSGGAATVTVKGGGRGGRNTEFALAFALATRALHGRAAIHALSVGTDGLDGSAGAAGAWVAADLLEAADAVQARASLEDNDSATFLARAGTLVQTGPTFTNVNDFRAILIEPR